MAGEAEPMRIVSRSVEETEALGERLGRALPPGAVVALDGELGSGKTALVRGLARGLGVEGAVQSPTFTLLHEHPGPVPLHHLDAWMAGRERDFLAGGGADYLGGASVAAVEWAERVVEYLPCPRLHVALAPLAHETRAIELSLVRAAADAGRRERELEERLSRALAACSKS
jgi:tRNA threonylcarbamoyladenosine biosynthesis protein TsaE